MGAILGFFMGGPAAAGRIQALLIAALVMALTCASLLVYGLWWRGEALGARVELTAAVAQGKVLSSSLEACSASVGLAQRVGEQALATGAELLTQARQNGQQGRRTAAVLETLAAQARKPGEDCNWAWDQIEQQRKARAAP